MRPLCFVLFIKADWNVLRKEREGASECCIHLPLLLLRMLLDMRNNGSACLAQASNEAESRTMCIGR